MKISPLEIKKQEFAKKFKGYDPEEVQSFLEMVSGEMEDALKRNVELEDKVRFLEEKLAHYSRMENVMHETLMTTKKSAEEIKANAEKMAESILIEAKLKSEEVLSHAREKLIDIRRELGDLKNKKESFLAGFRSLLETQKSLLDIIEKKSETEPNVGSIKLKSDISDEDLDKVINDFEIKMKTEANSPNNIPGGSD